MQFSQAHGVLKVVYEGIMSQLEGCRSLPEAQALSCTKRQNLPVVPGIRLSNILRGMLRIAGISALCMGSAPNLELLLVGRLLYGVGIGFAMHAAPSYIAEAAPARIRGVLIRQAL